MNEKQLREKLRSAFFGLTFNTSNYAHEKMLSMVTIHMNELLKSVYIGIYIYNDWNRTYKLISDVKKGPVPSSFLDEITVRINQKSIGTSQLINGKTVLKNHPEEMDSFIVRLDPKHGARAFLLLVFEDEMLSAPLLDLVRVESEQFLNIVNDYNNSKISDKKNQLLNELSELLYSTINLTEILSGIIKSLEKLYPNFTYHLYLSQDYEVDDGLPVEKMEYRDKVVKHASTEAFITGKVQREANSTLGNRCLYVPLKGNQGIYGVIQIGFDLSTFFPDDEVTFISKFAHIAGKAVENSILYQSSNHLVSDLKLINDASHKLNSNVKFSELIKIVKKQIIEACHATQVGFIYCNDQSDQQFDILEGSTSFFRTEQGCDFTGYVVKKMIRKPESIFSGDFKSNYAGLPYSSLMSIPMMHSGTMHGFIVIMHEEASFFTFKNFKLMKSLVRHSALALTNTILKDRLEKAVITDYLTKLYSRNYLDDMITMHMQLDEKGALILFDIDDFKIINDTHGHYVGDKVIIQVAKIIMMYVGEEDIPTRWGGEEFAIYLPHMNLNDGVQLANKIRIQVESNTEPRVTMSCGVSTWSKGRKDSVSEMFIRADEALYEAKEKGRNRLVTEN